jgi:hypothetical protein
MSATNESAGNLIPGCGVLGFGFDIFSAYNRESVLAPLVDLGSADGQWTSPAKNTYDIPANVSLDSSTSASGSAFAFSTKEAFTSHFAMKAGVKGSYGAFSGEFEASFAVDSSSESEYSYGLYEQDIATWTLTLRDSSRERLLANVTRDPDFTSLPSKVTADNEYLFFRFFAKYGTHFISRVQCGARMSYCAAVSKSYTSNTTEVSAKLAAEFRGVFADASANASADFKQADQRWFDSRKVTVQTTGGDSSLVGSISPAYEVNNNSAFERWLGTAEENPASVGFQLTPVSALFSGNQAAAVRTAYEAYANSRLYCESRVEGCSVILSGMPLNVMSPAPAEAATAVNPPSGVFLAVIDRMDLNVVFKRTYQPTAAPWTVDYLPSCLKMWDQAAADLKHYIGRPQYIVTLCTFGWWGPAYPTADMVTILESCGAGRGLSDWRKSWSTTFTYMNVTYALVSISGIGIGLGLESFHHAPDTRTGSAPDTSAVTGLLIPVAIDSGEEQFQFDLASA